MRNDRASPYREEAPVAPIVHSVEIARRPEDVFAYATDLPRFSEWQEGVVQARVEGDGPLRPGSRTTMTRRVGGREQTMAAEMTDFSPPQTFAFRGIDGPIRPSGKGRIEPVGDGQRSRFTFELDFEGRGFGKLLLPIVRRQAKKELPQNHQNLKERLERGTG
jgi:uncharacterized protein YndB with AHSA1/START domain